MSAANSNGQAGFFERLQARTQTTGAALCVGLDPRATTVDEVRESCGRLIEATADYAAAYKPNSAFFEAHGPEGMLALLDVIATVPDDIPVLLDAKRGDIASTSELYARAAFDTLGALALTVAPYVGLDGLAPFLARPGHAAFILCKTSNPGADEFQALPVQTASGTRPLYAVVAEHALQANSAGNIGLVMGATDLAAMAAVRALAPNLWFLVPGIGAQGGDLRATLAAGLRRDGWGLLVNVSRSVAEAANPRAEAGRLCAALRETREVVLAERGA